jgi:hypothetical protein
MFMVPWLMLMVPPSMRMPLDTIDNDIPALMSILSPIAIIRVWSISQVFVLSSQLGEPPGKAKQLASSEIV